MAVNPQSELVWQGRLQIGDEPGVYGDAAYTGLCAEIPLTVQRPDPNETTQVDFKVILNTDGLQTFAGFSGHKIDVILYESDPGVPNHFVERLLASDRFTGADNNHKEVRVPVGNLPGPFRLSVRLRADTTVTPGLYDDFVWIRLSLGSLNFSFFASLGFPN